MAAKGKGKPETCEIVMETHLQRFRKKGPGQSGVAINGDGTVEQAAKKTVRKRKG